MTTTEKKLNLGRLVRLQKMFSKIYRTTSLCSINDWGVHINNLDSLRDLAPAGSELATEFREGEIEWPYETSFDYVGVKFYAIHKENPHDR